MKQIRPSKGQGYSGLWAWETMGFVTADVAFLPARGGSLKLAYVAQQVVPNCAAIVKVGLQIVADP